jgi:hypothetical protein
MLKRRLTLDEYFADLVDCVRRGKMPQKVVDRAREQLESLAQPADEWWEWVIGTEYLRQIGGLALVRGGRVVYAHDDWIS